LVSGGLYGLLAVLLGALGAHALDNTLSGQGESTWEIAWRYHVMHALVLLIIGLWQRTTGTGPARFVVYVFVAGVLCFSGSLYLLALFPASIIGPIFGPITPIGGGLLIFGWAMLVLTAWRTQT